MRPIGLHLRLLESFFTDIVDKALLLKLPIFQCFFASKTTGYKLQLSPQEIKKFLKIRREYFGHVYAHASYWINLAQSESSSIKTLMYELDVAKRLGFTHLVLHPGSIDHTAEHMQGIDAFAKNLNAILKEEHNIQIVLENTVHAQHSIGGRLEDFAHIMAKINKPEKVSFCFDTAHAHSFGYDLISDHGQKKFFDDLVHFVGKEKIALIHLNDTKEVCGSKIDKHELIGDGVLGADVLKKIMMHDVLAHVPVIMELPFTSIEQEERLLKEVRGWEK